MEWQSLLKKSMNRKEFLITLGAGLVAVLGLSSALRLFGAKSAVGQQLGAATPRSDAFGASDYGNKSSLRKKS